MDENSVIIKWLNKNGYSPQTDYYSNIDLWEQWWRNNVTKFHEYRDPDGEKRELFKLGMAKRGCEDWSSILYTEKDSLSCEDKNNQEYLDKVLADLKFDDIIPENIENAMWSGTVGTIIRIKNAYIEDGKLKADEKTKMKFVNVNADSVIPLRVEAGEIIDVAFASTIQKQDETIYYLELHELKEEGYVIRNIYLNDKGEEVSNENVIGEYKTGSKYPLFSVLSPGITNNIKNNNGLGISIYANAIDELKGCDLTYNNYLMDTYLGGKKVFYNKSLVKYVIKTITDKDGNVKTEEIPIYPDDLARQQFRILEDDVNNANSDALIHEYNPSLRTDENERNINLSLSLYSFKIGLGKARYKFENGNIVTATQYVGDNQDLVSNAKKHRKALNKYTVGIARAILLLGRILFNESVNEEDNIELTNKDGFLVDDETLQEQYRQDFKDGLMSKKTYLMKARGMSEADAEAELALVREQNPSINDILGE